MRRRQRRPIIIILNVFISRGVYRVSQIYIQCTLSYWKALTATAKFQSILFSSFAVVCRETTGSLPNKVYYMYTLYCSFNLCLLESVVEFLLFFVVQRVPVLWWERERRVTTTRRWSRGFFLLSLPRNRLPRRHTHVRLKRVRERERKPKPHLIGNNERRR